MDDCRLDAVCSPPEKAQLPRLSNDVTKTRTTRLTRLTMPTRRTNKTRLKRPAQNVTPLCSFQALRRGHGILSTATAQDERATTTLASYQPAEEKTASPSPSAPLLH